MWFDRKHIGRIAASGLLCFGLAVTLAPSLRAAASVTASLDRTTVPLGESVTLTLGFRGASPNTVPQLPTLPNLNVAGVTTSSEYQINNGVADSVSRFNYQLVPSQEGRAVIPALQFNLGTEVVRTQPLLLQVTPASENPEEPVQAFIKLVLPQNTVYVGEAFQFEIHLYWTNGEGINTPQVTADGFSLIHGQDPTYQQSQTRVNNVPYNLLVFRMGATAARSGSLDIGPATCRMNLLKALRRSNPRSPFGGFFGNQFQRQPVELRSEPVPITVLPLPDQDVPASFRGAVGRYQMNVLAGPTNLAVGDPITVRTRITGTGHLDAVQLPEQSHWRDFKLYPASDNVETQDPFGMSGTKVFEQAVIPLNHDVNSLPPLEFAYFDTQRKAYAVLRGPAFPLQVSHARQSGTPVPSLTNSVHAAGPGTDDIIHIRPRLEGVIGLHTPWVFRPGFMAWQATPLALWLGLLIRRRLSESLARNPKLRRQREVARKVREGLALLHRQAEDRNVDEFFATLFRLLQEQLGERLDQPASAITEAVIDERLDDGTLPAVAREELHALFQTCNQARYAPHQFAQELGALVPRVENVLSQLQQWNR